MKKNFQIILLSSTILLLMLSCAATAAAAAPRPLELQYPAFFGDPEIIGEVTLPIYFRYIYYFFLGVAGIIALTIIVLAGVQYVASAGMPDKLSDARDRIKSAVFGLLILFSSWIILYTINPQLVIFRDLGELPPVLPDISPGILLCKQAVPNIQDFLTRRMAAETMLGQAQKNEADALTVIKKATDANCAPLQFAGTLVDAANDKTVIAYIVPDWQQVNRKTYGAIFYEDPEFLGNAQIIYAMRRDEAGNVLSDPELSQIWGFPVRPGISSAIPFKLNQDFTIQRSVTLFTYPGLETNIPWNAQPPLPVTYMATSQGQDISGLPNKIGSMRINGQLIVIFFKNALPEEWGAEEEISVFRLPMNSNLYKSSMGIWHAEDNACRELNVQGKMEEYPCAQAMILLTADPL